MKNLLLRNWIAIGLAALGMLSDLNFMDVKWWIFFIAGMVYLFLVFTGIKVPIK